MFPGNVPKPHKLLRNNCKAGWRFSSRKFFHSEQLFAFGATSTCPEKSEQLLVLMFECLNLHQKTLRKLMYFHRIISIFLYFNQRKEYFYFLSTWMRNFENFYRDVEPFHFSFFFPKPSVRAKWTRENEREAWERTPLPYVRVRSIPCGIYFACVLFLEKTGLGNIVL